MRRLLVVPLALFIAAHAKRSQRVALPPASTPLAITGVTVVDVTTGELLPGRAILIRGSRIVAVLPDAQLDPPPDARRIDGRGAYVIPGLWDMHAHLLHPDRLHFLSVFAANGVTGVRDMGSPMPLPAMHRLRAQIAAGERLGPRSIVAGPVLDGTLPARPELSVAVANPGDARRAVDSLQRAGADFIKVHSLVPRDAYVALADEARRRRIAIVGHVPIAVSIDDVAAAGQRIIEHLTDVGLACSADEERLRADLVRIVNAPSPTPAARSDEMRAVTDEIGRTYDAQKCVRRSAELARRKTWRVPTLVSSHAAAFIDDSTTASDPRLLLLPTDLSREWRTASARVRGARRPEDAERARQSFQTQRLAVTAALHRAGIPLLAGTDFPSPFVFPGSSVHDELALLVAAGLTPLEALRSATLNPARFLAATDSLGSVATGKLADLVLLDANPLTDIHNTTRIRAVIANGHYLDRPALHTLSRAPSSP